MRIELAFVAPRRQRLKSSPTQALLDDYLKRSSRYIPIQAVPYDSENALLSALDRHNARTQATLILLDSRGQSLSSEAIAERLGALRDNGAQLLLFSIGPHDGWSSLAWNRASLRLSLGPITLPHELALVVLAEQIYRAFCILAGHPYHGGHA